MTTPRTTWPAQIAVVLVLLAAGMASGANVFLSPNSPLGENAPEAGFRRAAATLSGGSHRGCGDLKPQDAAELFVALARVGLGRSASSPKIPATSAGVRDWATLEDQMTAHINDVAEGLGLSTSRGASAAGKTQAKTWTINFLETQSNGYVQFATVVEGRSGGGRILFDKAILFPAEAGSPELAKLPLKARIQVILTHEVTEGNVARTLQLGPNQMVDKSHDLSLLTSPYSDLTRHADPEVVPYLLKWKLKGGNPP